MKRVIVIRYGGFGDVIQAASILPGLKDQGFHVTFDTSEQGFEILRADPLVDALMLTPRDSVPDDQIAEYWNARTNGFNRVINLSESVENDALMTPARIGFFRDDETRRRLYGHINYVERIHEIAGVSGPFLPRFCPESAELAAAREQFSGKYVVLALAGSAEYKVWPWAPKLVERLISTSDARILLSGSENDAHLAREIMDLVFAKHSKDASRVVDITNFAVRKAYALAYQADLVIGPETGLMNAVAGTAGRKIVLLSHSSPQNLTKHWNNTTAIEPSVPCFPCHRLHQTTKFCPRGQTGEFAACAEAISPETVLAAASGSI